MKVECSRCHQVVDNDEYIKARHEQGRHQFHVVISERDGSRSKPMGNFDYGPVEWMPIDK
jgi:hypothetical protein